MKKEDLQNTQQGTDDARNNDENRDQQKNQITNISNKQRNDIVHQAGLGRDRMITDIEDMAGTSGRDGFPGSSSDDLQNEDLNATNDQ